MSRFAICKKCRKKWEISNMTDTSHGYICHCCDSTTGKGDWRRVKVVSDGFVAEIVLTKYA